MRKVGYIYDEIYLKHDTGEGHPESPQRLVAINEYVDLIKDKLTFIKPRRATAKDIAMAAVRPPGHHAEYSKAMGFCIFNNIAIAARYAQKNGYEKVFIIDFDAHHGNGTQKAFYEDDTVFYFPSVPFLSRNRIKRRKR